MKTLHLEQFFKLMKTEQEVTDWKRAIHDYCEKIPDVASLQVLYNYTEYNVVLMRGIVK